jgi:mono/diheme cytochrome c family protein
MPGKIPRSTSIILTATLFAIAFLAMASATGPPAPTFNKQVAPILWKHCANCHRPGEIASSMPLLSYEDAQYRADSIRDAVSSGEMPPWPADSANSLKFRNDARLNQQEIDTIVAWVKAGAAQGNRADLPPPPVFEQGWLHPQGLAPDLVMPLPTFHIPAEGEIPYVKYLARIPFSEDKWIVALQVRPSNRALVHHMAITEVALDDGVTPADLEAIAKQMGVPSGAMGTRPAVVDPANPAAYDMLGVYTPGTTFEMYGDDSAKLLKGGNNMYLNFNIHYQTTGKPETDQPSIAFWFEPKPPKHQLYRVPASGQTIIAGGRELLTDAPGQKAEGTTVAFPPIPPHADNYEVIGITAYTEPVTIYQFQPHAHLRGKDFKYSVVYPDGREETLLTVPHYQFHWQLAYDLDKPLHLPAGSKLIVTAHYDNSARNDHLHHHHNAADPEHNPSPEKEVYFREANQSWDEMFTPFIQYSIDTQDPAKAMRSESLPSRNGEIRRPSSSRGRKSVEIAETVGCLQQNTSGAWMLSNAGDAQTSDTQTTSSAALKAAATKPLGNQQYELLGTNIFNPAPEKSGKVVVKGALIKNSLIKDAGKSRLNVTSLQSLAASCP